MDLKISTLDNKHQDLLDALRDGRYHSVKISTTKKVIIPDRKDARLISSLNGVKIIFKKQDGGILILIGNLQNSFKQPFGGEFFLKKVAHETTSFEEVKGVEESIKFISIGQPTDISVMQLKMNYISNHPNFEFNIGQFDEFMEIFEFYKKLSDELNNNISYEINKISEPYFFIPFDIKDFDSHLLKKSFQTFRHLVTECSVHRDCLREVVEKM